MTKVISYAEYKKLALLYLECVNHLEYCGYGDNWERECADADKLPERAEAYAVRVTKILTMNGGTIEE